ncbi:peptidoglycan-binding protein [Streptomyces sp. NPDC057238]|uniref:peptidoglycan-binding domain-containing protein n=1 Tax=Streptomyces sp. NPDC057238 TaxID=3346060 RepID=UPI00363A32CF
MRRKSYITATAVALSIAGTLTIGTPASATVSGGYISGAGTVLDDLTDEGPVKYGQYSGAVAVWQTILWADGYLGTNHSAAVDCSFGNNTLAATKQWQRDHGLVADGVAGPKTFTKAGQYLRASGTNVYGEDIINYDSPRSSLRHLADRDSSGRWIVWANGGERFASYKYC